MKPSTTEAILELLMEQSEAKLESFFLAHDLQEAFNSPGRGWGRQKRINAALAEARRRGNVDEILKAAARHFGDSTERETVAIPQPNGRQEPRVDGRLAGLHPLIIDASGGLIVNGHYADAIFAAFRSLEARVRSLSALDDTGRSLMASAFNEKTPILRLNDLNSLTDRDEQEGFRFIFMGAMQGIRNPKAHDEVAQEDEDRAYDYLALASLLMRRLDDVQARL